MGSLNGAAGDGLLVVSSLRGVVEASCCGLFMAPSRRPGGVSLSRPVPSSSVVILSLSWRPRPDVVGPSSCCRGRVVVPSWAGRVIPGLVVSSFCPSLWTYLDKTCVAVEEPSSIAWVLKDISVPVCGQVETRHTMIFHSPDLPLFLRRLRCWLWCTW